MTPLRIAIVGLGKIARDQHIPAIAATDGITLVAIASRNASLDGVACFSTLDEMLAAAPEVDAVALCTPPQGRYAQALTALHAGKHVLLEKPPGATIGEVKFLDATAQAAGKTLFAAWHSRFAPGIEPARTFLAGRKIHSVSVAWKEDVRVWHPGQDWIFHPGGLGVFDPGINALSILTHILPRAFFLTSATLAVPINRDAPIAAELDFSDEAGLPIRAEFDFLQTGAQTWDIHLETEAGKLSLTGGGARLTLDRHVMVDEKEAEYSNIYRRFVDLVGRGASDVDVAPLVHVADAFMLSQRNFVSTFDW